MTTPLEEDQLSETFAALANATRRAIVARLAEGEATVNELAEPFALSLPAISRHIRVLEEAGLVRQTKRAQYRPCTLDAAPLAQVASWAEQCRSVWLNRIDRMETYLAQLGPQRKAGKKNGLGRHL